MPEFIEPMGFILLRVVGATLLFWSFTPWMKWEQVALKDLGRMALAGFFGVAANQLMFFQGLNITTPINAAIIMTTNPILVLVISYIVLSEAIGIRKLVGIGIGLIGAVLIVLFKSDGSGGALTWSQETAWGDLLVFLNATSYGIYLVVVKPLMKKYQPFTVIRWVFLFGLCFVIPFGFNQFTEINWGIMPNNTLWQVAFVVIGTTFFAYLFNIYALKRVAPSVVSTYIYSQPVLAAFIAIYWGKDDLTWLKVVAGILIFTGVYLVSIAPSRSTHD